MQNYQWNRRLRLPVAIDCICDVVFEGSTPVTKEAIDLLIKYLELTRDTVPSQSDSLRSEQALETFREEAKQHPGRNT